MARISSTEADVKLNPKQIRPGRAGLPPSGYQLPCRYYAGIIPQI